MNMLLPNEILRKAIALMHRHDYEPSPNLVKLLVLMEAMAVLLETDTPYPEPVIELWDEMERIDVSKVRTVLNRFMFT